MDPEALAARLEPWLQARPGLFELHSEPDGVRLVEVATGKPLQLSAEQVRRVGAQRNWTTGAEYLVVELDELPPVALADAGFVFSLDTRNTGPLPGAPPTMSFRDYRKLYRHLQHLVADTADAERRREALDVTMVLIASLDGARALGFPTAAEEGELEYIIRRLEAGA